MPGRRLILEVGVRSSSGQQYSEQRVYGRFFKDKDGNTIIMVTHEEYIASHARRVIRMRDGRIDTDERQDTGVAS